MGLQAQVSHAQPVTTVFPEPGLTRPRLRFGTGGVIRNNPALFPDVPDIPGAVSAWRVLEWRKPEVLRPSVMTRNDVSVADPALGTPRYTFKARGSRLSIFERSGSYVYELASEGGVIDAGGGSNLFLSARAVDQAQTFDRVMTYSVRLGLSRAQVEASDPRARQNGAVLAQVFSGFSIAFRDPASDVRASIFLQIKHADSRGAVPTHRGCTIQNGRRQIVYTGTLPDDPNLAFETPPPGRPLRQATYVLNRYLCDLLVQRFQCRREDGSISDLDLPAAAQNFGNWSVREMYIGLETEDTDLRPSSSGTQPQGYVSTALQLSDLRVLRDNTKTFDKRTCEP